MDALGYAVYRARALNFHVEAPTPAPEAPAPGPKVPAPVPKVVHFPQTIHTIKPYDLATIVSILGETNETLERQYKLSTPVKVRPTIGAIKALVCAKYGITECELVGDSHRRCFSYPRQIGYYLCSRRTMHSLPTIGRHFAGRDHTTILSGVNKIAEKRLTDKHVDADLCDLEARLA